MKLLYVVGIRSDLSIASVDVSIPYSEGITIHSGWQDSNPALRGRLYFATVTIRAYSQTHAISLALGLTKPFYDIKRPIGYIPLNKI